MDCTDLSDFRRDLDLKIENIHIDSKELYVMQFDCENTDLKKAA